jgi:hypothetical protein
VPGDGDRESGIRIRDGVRRSEQSSGATVSRRDEASRGLPPLVSDVPGPSPRGYFTAQEVALGMLLALALGALWAWLVSITGWLS